MASDNWPFSMSPSYNGLEGLDGGGDPMAMGIQAIGGALLSGYANNHGLFLGGLTGRNPYRRMEQQRFSLMHDAAMRAAAPDERAMFRGWLRGSANIAGIAWNDQTEAAANTLADTAAGAAPMMARMSPNFLDSFGGRRGSRTVLASHLMTAGQNMIDPMTGRLGLGVETVTTLGNQIQQSMYAGDNYRDRTLSMGQQGALFGAQQQRGVFGDLSGGVGGDKAGSIDSGKVIRTLKGYEKVVSAMSEIFGEAGKPNAPMGQLLKALDGLTGGGMQQMSTGSAEMLVRTTNRMAQHVGIGLEGAVALQQSAIQMTGSLGLNPAFSASTAMSGMQFMAGYSSAGLGGMQAWGMSGLSQLTQSAQALSANAAASGISNRLGVMYRMQSLGGAGTFTAGSDAAKLMQAVQAGQGTVRLGGRDVNISDIGSDRMTSILASGNTLGLAAGDIDRMYSQRSSNQQYVHENNVQGYVQGTLQKQAVLKQIGGAGRTAIAGALDSAGVGGSAQQRGALAAELSSRQAASALSDNAKLGDADRDKYMASSMAANLTAIADGNGPNAAAARQMINRYGGRDKLEEGLMGLSSVVTGSMNNSLQGSQFNSSLVDAWALTNGRVRDGGRRAYAAASAGAKLESALAPLGSNSITRNLAEAVISSDPSTSIPDLVARALGGVTVSEGDKARLESTLTNLRTQASAMRAGGDTAASAKGFDDAVAALNDISHSANLDVGGPASDSFLDAVKANETARDKALGAFGVSADAKGKSSIDAVMKKGASRTGQLKYLNDVSRRMQLYQSMRSRTGVDDNATYAQVVDKLSQGDRDALRDAGADSDFGRLADSARSPNDFYGELIPRLEAAGRQAESAAAAQSAGGVGGGGKLVLSGTLELKSDGKNEVSGGAQMDSSPSAT